MTTQQETDPLDQTRSATGEPLIVVASNRGPFSFAAREDGTFAARRGSGGLVTALSGIAERYGILWIAAALSESDQQWAAEHPQGTQVEDMQLRLLALDQKRYNQYYNVVANPLLWFIQHQLWDIPRAPSIDAETWQAWYNGYVHVNRQFAEAIADSVADVERDVIVLPQDYHLYMVPYFLRELVGDKVTIQPFVHIPWPGPDAWRILPREMRTGVLNGLLAADRVGFQTQRDAFNFVQTCRFYVPNAHSRGSRDSIEYRGRKVKARTYPISIDVEKVESLAEDPQTRLLKQQLLNFVGDSALILRVDRIEPSKNIVRSLYAFRALLEHFPEHLGKVQMLALLVPSRMEVAEYQNYLQELMAEAGMINAMYSDEFWEPVRIIVGENYLRAIAAMQLYDVLLVNPIADGMNLVAKEGALVNQHDGVLVLSEHAGAFYELGDHALIVSPFDIHGTARSLHEALTMPAAEREERAEALRQQVTKAGVRRWFADQVLDALRDVSSQAKKASTSGMPSSSQSAASRTESGVPSETTPKARQ